MRILILKANYFPVCGAGRLLETMLAHVDTTKLEPVVVEARTDGMPSSCHFVSEKLRHLPHATISWQGARRAKSAIAQLRRLIAEHEAVGVYSHDMRCDLLCKLAGGRRGLSVPFVAHVHGWAGSAGSARLWVYEQIDRWCCRAADEIWVGSEHALADAQRGLTKATPKRMFENALDPSMALAAIARRQQARASLALPDGAFAVGMHARLHRGKGHALLAEAALRCANKNVHAVLLGYGEEEAALRAIAASPRAKGRVHVVGAQRPEDTLACVAALDLYAYASLRESLPLAVLEAMAMGLPIVSFDVGDVASALLRGKAGVIVPTGDVAAMAAAIDALAGDVATRARLGEAAASAALSRFSPQRLAREVEGAWRELAGGAR